MAWVLVGLGLAAFVYAADRLWLNPARLLTAEDLLALPGRPLTLVARLERDLLPFLDPAIAGAEIAFRLGEQVLGVARTDALGFARFEAGPAPGPGLHVYTVTCGEAREELVVKVIEPGTPVLVLDLDETISAPSSVRFWLSDVRRVRPLAGSERVLPGLVARRACVYLTARDHSLLAKSRAWLRLRGLPTGPLLIRRNRWPEQAEEHKTARLLELAKEHRLWAGVGDKLSDMRAYRARGMKAYLMRPTGAVETPEGAVRVTSWADLADLLERDAASA